MEKRLYERNKDKFPYSRFEVYDPGRYSMGMGIGMGDGPDNVGFWVSDEHDAESPQELRELHGPRVGDVRRRRQHSAHLIIINIPRDINIY